MKLLSLRPIATSLALATLLCSPLFAAEDMAEEMRACWVSRFNWTVDDGSAEKTKEHISSIMKTMADNNFNAILFQVRGECDTLYPSPYEPWGPQFNWTDPGWDPVAFAIEEAHKNNLEFHAYFNTHTLTAVIPPENTTPQHPYNLHGPKSDDPWVIHNAQGEPMEKTDSYSWISPGNPDASAWTRKNLMYLVETYDIDGVHFDRIRTPGQKYSHDPKTVDRFNGDGNPDQTEWGDFMRAQITRDLRRIYGAIALRKPNVKITTAPFGICKKEPGGYQGTGTESYYDWYQDSFGWMENGVVDGIFPMIYWGIGSAHPFDVLLSDFMNHTGGRHVYAGIHSRRDPIAQIYETRRQKANGSTIWSYGRGNLSAYKNLPYQQPAAVPSMPWKETPTTAIVAGTVTSSEDQPILDAWIMVGGNPMIQLTGADGFYSILNLKPGTHTITVRKNGLGQMANTVTVKEGDVCQLDFDLGATDKTEQLISESMEAAAFRKTRLRPEYVQELLENRDQDEKIYTAFEKALSENTSQAKQDLLHTLELHFIHDPEKSILDLLNPERREAFNTYPWGENDYPGGPKGEDENFAYQMVGALGEIRPERRANRTQAAVVIRSEASEEVWDYIIDQWATVPDQEKWNLNNNAQKAFVAMREQAHNDGVELFIFSAHRDRKKAAANAARVNNPAAVASFSAHSLGLAIDFKMSQGDLEFSEVTTRPMSEVVRMRSSPVYKWLFLTGDQYGWYPYQHEPWHWEYNPPGFREIFWKSFPGGAPARNEQQ